MYFCTDSQFKLPEKKKDDNVPLIEKLRKIHRLDPEKDKELVNSIQSDFLISGLNLRNASNIKIDLKSNTMKIYSSTNTYSSDCYVIEIDGHRVANPIKMRPAISKMDQIYSLPKDIFIV